MSWMDLDSKARVAIRTGVVERAFEGARIGIAAAEATVMFQACIAQACIRQARVDVTALVRVIVE